MGSLDLTPAQLDFFALKDHKQSKEKDKAADKSRKDTSSLMSTSKKSKKHRDDSSESSKKKKHRKGSSSSDDDDKHSKKHRNKDKARESETRKKNDACVSVSVAAPTKRATWESYNDTDGKTEVPHLYSDSRINRKMESAKLKHRTSLTLSDWQRYKFYDTFDSLRASYTTTVATVSRMRPSYVRAPGRQPICQWLDHIRTQDFSVEKFASDYEKMYYPVVIEGCADHWPGRRKWTLPALAAGPYRDTKFKIGEDDDGNSIKVKLKYFMQYLVDNKDDSPLYLFDGAFDERSGSKSMLADYDLPCYFRADLFRYVGEKRRPPYRWFAIGPERSGSSVHIDPLGTSAWNTLIVGKKLWVLFHPDAAKPLVKGEHLRRKGEDNEAITYFARVLPRIIAEEEKKAEGPSLGMRMFIQEPGQTVFVPGGWWHGVLNLEHSVAVTQNFASDHNFAVVWRKTRKSRKHMGRRWLNELERNEPNLFKQALEMDKADNFEWVFSDKKKKDKKSSKKKDKNKDRSPEKRQPCDCSDS
jgi:histone arginine demethylase JMJD6